MSFVLAGIALIFLTGFVALFLSDERIALRLGAVGMILGALPPAAAAVRVLGGHAPLTLRLPWQIPCGSFHVALDGLAALFLLPVLVVCSLAAVYGIGYMAAHRGRRLGVSVFFFNLLAAGMAMVTLARDGVLFLIAWELMSLASFFLVTFDDEHESVREAGWIYLIATHIGTAFLLAFFILLGKFGGSMDFAAMTMLPSADPAAASVLFLLALVGFGTKAGLMPLHVWLPEAHPAAPSHVSAVMSGVMIKMGIYGIVRTIAVLPSVEAWWGWLLIAVGAVSGILGVLTALAQHDLKRLLAYHSVENIGIIILGLGVGVLGLSSGSNLVAFAGFAGALFHVINHALFKGLLFLGAGAVAHAAGTREIDMLGGLIRQMPFTAAAFVIGAVAICGLPPLNGFISEFLIYCGAFTGTVAGARAVVIPALIVIASLSLIGGLALACFTKAFGFIFLGHARSEKALHAHEVGPAMRIAMGGLAAGCIAAGLLSPFLIDAITPAVSDAAGRANLADPASLRSIGNLLWNIVGVSAGLALLSAGLFLLRHRRLSAYGGTSQETWGCGYIRPTPRMQYTASSFARPLTSLFAMLLQTHTKARLPEGLFPDEASLATHTPDVSREYLFKPVFLKTAAMLDKLRILQHGSVQLYVLYIAVTLLILLVWKLQ